MDEDNPSTIDFDDAQIIGKFNSLLNKYQNQGMIPQKATSTPIAAEQTCGLTVELGSDKIPVLTDVVILHPSVIQPQPKRLRPMQQILDAALVDAQIEMSASDRKALAIALESRLDSQIKNCI